MELAGEVLGLSWVSLISVFSWRCATPMNTCQPYTWLR
jgi:hypothetical protein